MFRRVVVVLLVWFGMVVMVPTSRASLQTAGTKAPQPPPNAAADAAALKKFSAMVANYVALRKKIREEIPDIQVTPKASEINAASDALARAVQRARPNAQQGAFFTPEIAGAIRRTLEAALNKTDRAAVLALINEEPGALKRPNVHQRFPAGDILATTPAVLLQVLPTLPKELEYRFVGRLLILRDIDAALVLDYMPAALPAQ